MADNLLQSINIESFEKAVYLCDGSAQAVESVFNQLLDILGQVRQGSGFLAAPEESQQQCYTRLAGAITAMIVNPRIGLSEDGFVRLCQNHAQVHAIFRASAYETMDHILSVLGTRQDAEKMDFHGDQSIMKLLVCWALDSDVEIDFEAVARTSPVLAAWAMIGMLSVGGSHTEKSYARRLMLMRQRHLIAQAPLNQWLIQSMGDCYMHCSYTDAPDKHEIKRTINDKLFEVVARSLPVRECTTRVVRKERPTIVVPLEWFGGHHAMYRCYAPSMLELRQRFRVVGVFRDNSEVDDIGQKVFDKAVKLGSDVASIAEMINAVQAEEPDIIYYPSLGMAAWYVAMSNFRLAPIQVVSPGHPASTMSKCIDYIVSDGDLFGAASDYSEQLVPLPVGTVRYIGMRDTAVPQAKPKRDGTVRIAIPAMASKLVPPFLRALRALRESCKVPLEFHFFPNMTGLAHVVITKDLRRWFPDAVVRHRHYYPQYLDWLAECDFAASTFPFGGTNSIIDCFLCGLPMVTLEGPHVHGRSDASMMRRVGLDDWLITHSEAEYVDACRRLAEDELERELLRDYLKHVDVQAEFYGAGPPELRGGFLAAFERIYDEGLHGQEDGLPQRTGTHP